MPKSWNKLALLFAMTVVSLHLSAQQRPVMGVSGNAVSNPAVVFNYWTPERMASAQPMDLLAATGNEPADNFPVSGSNEPIMIGPSAPPPGEDASVVNGTEADQPPVLPPGYSYPYPFTRYDVVPLLYSPPANVPLTFPYKAIGKLFFVLHNVPMVCSASVIAPHLLLTARHCIFEGADWATMVMFAPGYFNGNNNQLGGRWVARNLATWTTGAGNRYDIGFVQLADDNGVGCGGSQGGRPIESYTGHLGWFTGGSYDSVHWNEFGYPAAGMFNGQVMIESDSSTGELGTGAQTDTVGVGNDMTGGASGCPWIRHMFPNQSGTLQNLANGVNSFKYNSKPFALSSPQFFQYNFGNLYNGAVALSCP